MRTRFAKEIVCEFLPPVRKSNKIVILASGAPTYPGKNSNAMNFLSEKGYWSFVPRYRGTWESDGTFLEHSPHEDVIAVIDGIQKGFADLVSGTKYKVAKPQFYLVGGSFGGPAVLLGSIDPRVKKTIAISPVVDWSKQEGTTESLDLMSKLVPLTFGQAYRGNPEVWKQLARGDFYSPVHEEKSMHGKNIMIIHAKDDDVVPFMPAHDFAERIGATFVPLRTGGHMGSGYVSRPSFWKRIDTFFRAK